MRCLQLQQRGDRRPARRSAACARADAERPASDRALRAARALDLAERVGVDLLVDARHGGQDRRPRARERLRHARRVGDERERRAVERRRLVAIRAKLCAIGRKSSTVSLRPRCASSRAARR